MPASAGTTAGNFLELYALAVRLARCDETGLKAASVCCNTHWDKPLSAPDPAVREAGLAGLKVALADAKRYGATSVLHLLNASSKASI